MAAPALTRIIRLPDAGCWRGRVGYAQRQCGGYPMNYPVLAQEPQMADFSNDTLLVSLIKGAVILVFLLVSVLFALWFERRIIGRLQQRLGPNVRGPFGLAQSIPDALKLLLKEDITVRAADRIVYLLAPLISVITSFMIFAVIPFGPETEIFGVITPLQLTDMPVAVLYILAVTAMGVYGIVLGRPEEHASELQSRAHV